MEKMLEVDADKRITAAQTLSHPYLEEVSKKIILVLWTDNYIVTLCLNSTPTPRMNPLPLSTIKLSRTTNFQLRFGKVRIIGGLRFSLFDDKWICLEKVWSTIIAFREEMFGEPFTPL